MHVTQSQRLSRKGQTESIQATELRSQKRMLEKIQASKGHITTQRLRKLGQGLNKKGQIQTACNIGSKVRYRKGQCQRQKIQERVKVQYHANFLIRKN